MPGKMTRSAPLPPFGVPVVTAVARATNLSCQAARKARIFKSVRESSGESRSN